MAEAESGSNGVELFEQDTCTADNVAAALSAMTFALGRRFVIADGVERWKDADVEPVAAAMAGMDPDTLTVAFFAREEGRYKAPPALNKAVEAVGGVVAAEAVPKARALPKWIAGQAKEIGIEIDDQAARALVAQVGRTLRMPSFAADRLISDVSARDPEAYRRALQLLADLEMESRGGGGGVLSEDTAAVRAVIEAAR